MIISKAKLRSISLHGRARQDCISRYGGSGDWWLDTGRTVLSEASTARSVHLQSRTVCNSARSGINGMGARWHGRKSAAECRRTGCPREEGNQESNMAGVVSSSKLTRQLAVANAQQLINKINENVSVQNAPDRPFNHRLTSMVLLQAITQRPCPLISGLRAPVNRRS